MVWRRSALTALRTFSRFSLFRLVEGRPDLVGSSNDISPPLNVNTTRALESYLKLLATLKVLAADFPNRKKNFTHTLCSLLSPSIKIAKLRSRHIHKSHNSSISKPRLTSRVRLLEYCVDSWHLAAYCETTTSSRSPFTWRLFLGPPSYAFVTWCMVVIQKCLQFYDIFSDLFCMKLLTALWECQVKPVAG
jgi:hypothetical protein